MDRSQKGRAYDSRGNVRPADERFLGNEEEPKSSEKAEMKSEPTPRAKTRK